MMPAFRDPPESRRRARAAWAVLALGATAAVVAALLSPGVGGPAASPEGPAAAGPVREADRPGAAPEGRSRGRSDRSGARPRWPRVEWRRSLALGTPTSGRLVRGVQMPREGRAFFTWDPVQRESPNRSWRRHGTDSLVRMVLGVLRDHRAAHPRAPRVAVGDLSRPRGGDFGVRYGIVGHASHQNGLDVDVYYPRRDRRERAPGSVRDVDWRLAQDLVDRLVDAGAAKVLVGPATGLTGPEGVVQVVSNHDDHLHVRIEPAGSR